MHTYPEGKDTPADRLALIDIVNRDLNKIGVPDRIELWDTEVNYGIKGPGKIKGQTITGGQAADWTASTFLDSILTGIDRTYWYYWYRPDGRLGIILDNAADGDFGRLGYQTAYDWMVNSFYSCTRGGAGQPNVCQLGDADEPRGCRVEQRRRGYVHCSGWCDCAVQHAESVQRRSPPERNSRLVVAPYGSEARPTTSSCSRNSRRTRPPAPPFKRCRSSDRCGCCTHPGCLRWWG